MKQMRRSIVAVLATMTLAIGLAGPAAASGHTVVQDGLVNVSIGDVTILEDVNVAVAANILAAVCANLDVAAAVLAVQGVDFGGDSVDCTFRGGRQTITIDQN